MNNRFTSDEYKSFIQGVKDRIQVSQIKAAVKVNVELLRLYWDLARLIVEKQKESAWGSKFITQVSKDLKNAFPDLKGFSITNLSYMKKWYLFYADPILPQVVGELGSDAETPAVYSIFRIPWGHNREIITKCESVEEALFYVNQTIKHNWSRVVLVHQIESNLIARAGQAVTNFENRLPVPQSDLARQTLKDPYNFDFLTIRNRHDEKELEQGLVDHITHFLLELGAGFSFVGRQYRLEVGGDEFFIDLLFYHVKLHCYVVVELKTKAFKPEYVGQLNFYISAIDGEVKSDLDNPTIGLLICKSKNNIVVEYALKKVDAPIGVSEYTIAKHLPDEFKSSLPSIEEIEAELNEIK